MNLRPVSNLVVPAELKLPRDQVRARFMYVYTSAFKGRSPQFFTKLWASPLFPSITHDPKFGANAMSVRKGIKGLMKKAPLGAFLKINKVMDASNPHFVANIPVYAFHAHNPQTVVSWLRNFFLAQESAKNPTDPSDQTMEELNNFDSHVSPYAQERIDPITNMPMAIEQKRHWTGVELMQAFSGLDAAGTAALRQCLLGMDIKTKGSMGVVFLNFKITKEEAQQLTTTRWVEMRNMDLYPLLKAWVDSYFGYTHKGASPTASFPVTRIAREIRSIPINVEQDARVNEHGLSIGPNGKPYYLPAMLDNSVQYEDRYNQAGSRAGDGFALMDFDSLSDDLNMVDNIDEDEEGEGEDEGGDNGHDFAALAKLNLPANMPVLIDWVNNKYSYTNSSGALQVLDLVRYRKADVSHITRLLKERYLTQEMVVAFRNIGDTARVHANAFQPQPSDLDDPELAEVAPSILEGFQRVEGPDAWFKQAVVAYQATHNENKGIPLGAIRTNGISWLRPLARYFKLICGAVEANLDAIYNKYSVHGTSERYAQLILIAKYADKLQILETQDNANRKAAINQGVDPNWTLPPVPLLDANAARPIGRLPHQEKVRNLLKDSPDFAILPVQAGGGKSMLLLLDILLEIKANRSEPYLVMCPGHLVPNYVKEVQAFTGGRLNVIPITTYTLVRQGWKRLQALLEAAPRNSVVVVDYDVLKYRPRTSTTAVCYGTTAVDVFPVIEFLRQFRFGYVALDESHKVKNDSARTKAAMSLITDIPKKRLASGTMAHESALDLATQIAMMDPTLFGTREDFIAEFAEDSAGGKVKKWKENYSDLIMNKIKERVVVASAMRKEWAAFLPKQKHHFKGIALTPEQYRVYNLILKATLEEIAEAAKNNPELAKFLNNQTTAETDVDPETKALADADEEEGESLASLLKPYLMRLESFVNAPGLDDLGKIELKGEDLHSPKVAYAIHRLRLHIEGGEDVEGVHHEPETGKVLIFANSHKTVDAIWDAMPADLKACGLKYASENKEEDADQFENNENIRWMVGIEQSMNEGLNFQFATRLIRMSGVWNPGTLEQGNSRINRPELKKSVKRDYIYYDWLMADGTIDITKISRLISKLVAVAKFENHGDPKYMEIANLPVIKMDLDSIINNNTWSALADYRQAYGQFVIAQAKDYEDYAQNYIKKFGRPPELMPVEHEEAPKDARLMATVPYIPGQRLIGEKQLGLMRLDEYVKMEEDDDSDDSEIDVPETASEKERRLIIREILKGRRVHTEFGEGYIQRSMIDGRRCDVVLDDGNKINLRMSAVFLLTDPKKAKNVRAQVLQFASDYTGLEVTEPVTVPSSAFKPGPVPKAVKEKKVKESPVTPVGKDKPKPEESQTIVELQFTVTNGFLGIDYFVEESNQAAANILEALGFRHTPPFVYAEIKSHKHLLALFNAWAEAGFTMDTSSKQSKQMTDTTKVAINDLYHLLEKGAQIKNVGTYKFSTKNDLRNFYRLEFKPSNDPNAIKPYPLVENGRAYIAMPVQGQSGTKRAIQVKVPGIKWMHSEPTLSYYGLDRAAIAAMLRKIQENGVQISNRTLLLKQFRRLKKVRVKLREGDPEANKIQLARTLNEDNPF